VLPPREVTAPSSPGLPSLKSAYTSFPLPMFTLAFVKMILLLEAAVYRISAERFGNHPISFSDSIEKLDKHLAFVDTVLEDYNRLARLAHFSERTRDSISNGLAPLIDREVSLLVLVAKGTMPASLHDKTEWRDEGTVYGPPRRTESSEFDKWI
jgi:hypothetical protein